MVLGSVFEGRLKKLQGYLKSKEIDMVMVTAPINIYYFTGFYSDPHERFMSLIVNKEGQSTLFVPSLDEESATQSSKVTSIIPVSDTEDPYQLVKQQMKGSIQKLGIEKKVMNIFQAERIKEIFPQASLEDVEEFMMSLRLKKEPEDILIVKKAIDVVERVLQHGVSKVAPGVTELELTAELEYQMKVLGAERPAFSTIVLSGKNSALPHGRPGDNKIEAGEFLLFDLGVFVNGYCSDITRTFLVGEGSAEHIKIYETVKIANQKAIEAVNVGSPIGEVDRAARSYIESQGYGKYFIHRVGHGLGLEVHEEPSIHSDNRMAMQPGLLFTIEPGIYIPKLGGVRIEDDIYIHPNGEVEVLTSYSKELTVL